MTKTEFNERQIKILEKIGIRAARHAVNALSKMIKHTVEFNLFETSIKKVEEVSKIIKDKDEHVVGIYFKLLEEIQGVSLITFPIESSFKLVDLCTDKKLGSTNKIESDFEKSILMETGNIVLGAFLTIFSSMTDVLIIGSVPHIAEDTTGSIFNSVVAEMGVLSDILLTIDIKFIARSEIIKGFIYILIDENSSKKILEALN